MRKIAVAQHGANRRRKDDRAESQARDSDPKLASGKIQRKTMREWSKADAKMLTDSGFKARM